jgi:hypothetical protein
MAEPFENELLDLLFGEGKKLLAGEGIDFTGEAFFKPAKRRIQGRFALPGTEGLTTIEQRAGLAPQQTAQLTKLGVPERAAFTNQILGQEQADEISKAFTTALSLNRSSRDFGQSVLNQVLGVQRSGAFSEAGIQNKLFQARQGAQGELFQDISQLLPYLLLLL